MVAKGPLGFRVSSHPIRLVNDIYRDISHWNLVVNDKQKHQRNIKTTKRQKTIETKLEQQPLVQGTPKQR